MGLRFYSLDLVGRTPWSAADALVGLCEPAQEAGQGAGCGPGVRPTRNQQSVVGDVTVH